MRIIDRHHDDGDGDGSNDDYDAKSWQLILNPTSSASDV